MTYLTQEEFDRARVRVDRAGRALSRPALHLEVGKLLVAGHSQTEVAERVGKSKTRVWQILRKLKRLAAMRGPDKPPFPDNFWLADLPCSVRCLNYAIGARSSEHPFGPVGLASLDIFTVGALRHARPEVWEELRRTPNCGKHTIDELRSLVMEVA